jgi:puromycin-sensitive aminopeptidase
MFDTLTYEKGASVLRMLEQYLGAGVFREGVRRYIAAHAYANTVTADLWDALEEASGEPIRAVAESWILQGGHPLVRVSDTTLSQEPFAYLPEPPGGASSIGKRWLVPVLVRDLASTEREPARVLLADASVPLPASAASRTALVNAGGWGVYRVGYLASHRAKLAEELQSLTALERFGLVSDTWALVLAGQDALGELVEVAARLGEDEGPENYQVIVSALSLCDRIAGDEGRPLVQSSTRALLGPRARGLGWDRRGGEGERVPTLRALLVEALGTIGATAEVRAEAARRFDAWRNGEKTVDADIASAVLAVVADQARAGDYDAVLDRYRHPANPQDERRHLLALGSFADVGLCHRTFDLAMSEVRRQDGPFLVRTLLANRLGGPAIWERVKADWERLLDRFPDVSHHSMLASVRQLCGDPELADDVTRFLTDHPLEVGQRSVEQTLEQLAVHVRFGERMRAGGRLGAELGKVGAR